MTGDCCWECVSLNTTMGYYILSYYGVLVSVNFANGKIYNLSMSSCLHGQNIWSISVSFLCTDSRQIGCVFYLRKAMDQTDQTTLERLVSEMSTEKGRLVHLQNLSYGGSPGEGEREGGSILMATEQTYQVWNVVYILELQTTVGSVGEPVYLCTVLLS